MANPSLKISMATPAIPRSPWKFRPRSSKFGLHFKCGSGALFLCLRNGNDKVVPRFPSSTLDSVLGVDSERSYKENSTNPGDSAKTGAAVYLCGNPWQRRKVQ